MNIIYIRTSTEEQNPENQLHDCKVLATKLKLKDWVVVSEQLSAWKDNVVRPKFDVQIRGDIKKRKVKHFICWDVDRIYRNRKKLLEFFKFCKLYGCKIHSYRQQFLESVHEMPPPFDEAMHDFMLHLWGWLAEDESKKKSQRVRAALRKRNGKTYSYKGNKWGKKPLGKKTINEVMELNKQGLTLREIASKVHYWDNQRNRHQISKSAVHKLIKEHTT